MCEDECHVEQLREGWKLCATTGLAYRTDDSGDVIEWATTQRHAPPKPKPLSERVTFTLKDGARMKSGS